MAYGLDSNWGPYRDQQDAASHLSMFVDHACGPAVGISWASNGYLYPLRAPVLDADGFGDVLVFHWSHIPEAVPKPAPPTGFWGRAKAFIERCMEAQVQSDLVQTQAQLAMSGNINRVIDRAFSHNDDTMGIAIDVFCVATSLILIPTGLGMLGLVALGASGYLLYADGRAYGMELQGNEEDAENYKKQTEKYRIIATLLTLPDFAAGLPKVWREISEARAIYKLENTARAAENMAARTSNSARAERFANVAERAHARSREISNKIQIAFALEISPRAASTGGWALLFNEHLTNLKEEEKEARLRGISQRLQIHSAAVKR
ncbi:hypothetical protein [Nitrospirillum pindoramense]|uniref:Uncharacterized protein n=1 Tax=Nitrospirillum amazonense TaxID=28077 RepID=A0A560H696_9PROT|nr:hypothetical protein [Nitrospirillum amazonense]TWB41090.1 hypothetical protein FBZ90_108114 [Nitrospirillum amazonense]